MVKTVIGAAIIYYLGLEWWWWGLLVGAFFIDVYQEHVNNINDVTAVNNLSSINQEIEELNEKIKNSQKFV